MKHVVNKINEEFIVGEKKLEYFVLAGDAKTYEYLARLKHKYEYEYDY